MDKPEPNLHFRAMALSYRIRDMVLPRERILEEAGIKPGSHLLDYGCGPGSYLLPAARLVGESGRIYALDIHPLAVRSVKRIAAAKRLTNVQTILSDCDTGLPELSIDVVLLYDVLHDLSDPTKVVRELRRVLKPNGILSFSDHHLEAKEIVSTLSDNRLFRLLRRGKRTYTFSPEEP